ncbi:putative Ig domain-containing protein, partial [Aliivibrio finisterrensis]
ITIDIIPQNDAPTIANITGQSQTNQDALYTLLFNADDVDMGDTLNFNVQNKPNWLTLDSNNQTLSGTPTNNDVATYSNIIIDVTDSSNVTTQSNSFEIEVININDAPTISGMPTADINQGVGYTFTPTYGDPDEIHGTETKTFSIQNKPSWLTFDSTDGTLDGIPQQNDVGAHNNITITVEDAAGLTDSLSAFTITVNNVNDAPTGSDVSVTAAEDSNEIKFKDTDFSISDIDGDILSKIIITSLPNKGKLTLSNSDINANTDVTLSDLQAENLHFEFFNNEFGSPYTTFTFKYHDGQIESAADYTATINITGVEDQLEISLTLSAPLTEDDSNIGVNPVIATYTVDDKGEGDIGNTTLTPTTAYQLAAGNSITLTQDGLDTLNSTGTLPVFTLSVDDNGTQNPTAVNGTPNVTSINDLPIANNSNVTVIEDTLFTFTANDFGYTDEESSEYSAIIIEMLPSDGTLTYSAGTAITQGQTFSRVDISNIQYEPAQDLTSNDSFTFHVIDDEGESSVSTATMTITITSANDAPSLAFNSPDKAFVKGDGSTALLSNVNITDIDSTDISGATITLTGATTNEILALGANSSSIVGSYDASTNTLTLTGNASISDYQTALEAVQYSNSDPSFTQTTNDSRSFDVTVTDVSVDTTQSLLSAIANGSLTLFGEFTNIQQYAANSSNPLAQEPTDAHYQALGFATNSDDGYFSHRIADLNIALLNDTPSLSDLSALRNYINTDNDRDGVRAYKDLDDSLVHTHAYFTLHPEISGDLRYTNDQDFKYLFKINFKLNTANGGAEVDEFILSRSIQGGYNQHLAASWPRQLGFALNAKYNNGISATTDIDATSNTVSGVDWMELDYIAEWWTVLSYIKDSNQNPAPSDTDFAAIGINNVTAQHVNELRSLTLNQSNASDYSSVINLGNSYVIIHDYAKDSGNPITATAPQGTDYNNIGLTQDVSNVSEFNAWLNDAQLVVVTDISTMVNVINHAKTIFGASVPTETDYTQAGITGVDASNVGAVNSAVQAQGADTFAGVQAIVDGENGWNDLIDYASQAAGSQA